MASTEQSTKMIKKAIKEIEGKMKDPSFLEQLNNNGHKIASDFLELVRMDLNWIGIEAGRDSPIYIELCEAVALIGSGCLRWATARTRTFVLASDFRKNTPIYDLEKAKVEKCYELIKVFTKMIKQDSSEAHLVFEVNSIIEQLYSYFQKKAGWRSWF
jgi:hypothetical protein